VSRQAVRLLTLSQIYLGECQYSISAGQYSKDFHFWRAFCEWQNMSTVRQASMVARLATWKERDKMNGILILGEDKELGEVLREILHRAGYSVTLCSDTPLALAMLEVATSPLVVLLPHRGSQEEWLRILAAAPHMPPHAYLIVSTETQHAPRQWNPHTRAFVPVLSVPVDAQLLLATIADGAGRLYGVPYLLPVM
jgi:CheY-like chemotaxis protein